MAGLNITDKIKLVNHLKSEYKITELCKTFNLSRSTYYYRQNNKIEDKRSQNKSLYSGYPAYDRKGNKVPEKEIVELVKEYCDKYSFAGYRMITDHLRFSEGLKVNYKRIYRMMDVLDLLQDRITPKPNNYKLKQKHELTGPDPYQS